MFQLPREWVSVSTFQQTFFVRPTDENIFINSREPARDVDSAQHKVEDKAKMIREKNNLQRIKSHKVSPNETGHNFCLTRLDPLHLTMILH